MLSSFSLTLTPVHRNLVFLFDKLKVCSCMGQPMDLKQRKVVASWFHKKNSRTLKDRHVVAKEDSQARTVIYLFIFKF